ncbi:unnamed protein product [Caenorhabditis angaria]|uniref:Uncharacterized protein n=1 Tax=Caenorhabditis angaria TaxID=860376 RepID=A0A9P1IVU4_9PELO|nr:unnamed protein product [Caenorhabditis angaria]
MVFDEYFYVILLFSIIIAIFCLYHLILNLIDYISMKTSREQDYFAEKTPEEIEEIRKNDEEVNRRLEEVLRKSGLL